MAALAPEPQHLDGIGKKLKKAVKKVATVTKAIVAPTKKSVKAATTVAVEAKKDIGLNKLGTRKAVKAVHKGIEAVVTANKDKLKSAAVTAGQSPTAALVVTAAGNAIVPGSGAAIAAGLRQVAVKDQAKKVDAQVNAYMAQAAAEEAAAAAAAAAPAPDAMVPVPETAAATDTAPAWPRYLLWGSAGLLVVGLALRSRTNEQRTMRTA